MKCPNCGADIGNEKKCQYCGSTIARPKCPECGSPNVSFKRENQKEIHKRKTKEVIRKTIGICGDCGYTWEPNDGQKKSNKWMIVLWILGWIYIFPIPLTIIMVRKKDMKAVLRYGIAFVGWVVYFLLIVFAGNKDVASVTIAVPGNPSEFKGKDFEVVVERFKDAGFENVEVKPVEDLVFGFLAKENTVESIYVNGSDSFYERDRVSKDSKVLILYHSFPEKTEQKVEEKEADEEKMTVDSKTNEETTEKDEESSIEKEITTEEEIGSFVDDDTEEDFDKMHEDEQTIKLDEDGLNKLQQFYVRICEQELGEKACIDAAKHFHVSCVMDEYGSNESNKYVITSGFLNDPFKQDYIYAYFDTSYDRLHFEYHYNTEKRFCFSYSKGGSIGFQDFYNLLNKKDFDSIRDAMIGFVKAVQAEK